MLANRIVNVFLYSILIGAIIPPLAIYFAFELDVSSGPTAVVAVFILFLIVFLFKKIKK